VPRFGDPEWLQPFGGTEEAVAIAAVAAAEGLLEVRIGQAIEQRRAAAAE